MEKIEITSYSELLMRIEYLKLEKTRQEEDLKVSFKEFTDSLDPIQMLKQSLHKLAEDKEVQVDLTRVGVSIGVNYIINKILYKSNNLKGFLSSVLINLLSTALTTENISKIINAVTNFIHPNVDEETAPKSSSKVRK